MMPRKTHRVVFRALALTLFLYYVLSSHLFGVFRPPQQPCPVKTLSPPSSASVLPHANNVGRRESRRSLAEKTQQEIRIVAAVCADRVDESLVMMKSALIMSSTFIRFIVFADQKSIVPLNDTIRLWPENILKRMSLDLRQIHFPDSGADQWKKLFKLCSSERLFLPSLLKEEESVLYMDIDTVFLSSPLHIWQHFSQMNQTQMVALATEDQDYTTGWYPAFAKHPYYGKFGVNAGVMLMNLTKMRQFGWERYIVRVYEQYKTMIPLGDQDIINIVFHFHPEKLYVFPCNYNYIVHHCTEANLCKEAKQQGIYILHGNTEAFLNDLLPAFKAIYTAMQQHSFGDNLQMLLANMKDNLIKTSSTYCGKVMNSLPKLMAAQS